jgi:hypothetical protein
MVFEAISYALSKSGDPLYKDELTEFYTEFGHYLSKKDISTLLTNKIGPRRNSYYRIAKEVMKIDTE